MDAKYNWIIDSKAIRVGMVVAGFAVWLAAGTALISLAKF